MFIGAGVSKSMKIPTWDQFAKWVLDDLACKKLLNYNETQSLKKLEPRTILSIAKIIDDNLEIVKYFKSTSKESAIYQTLNSIGCTFVTTNYDLCLKPIMPKSKNSSIIEQQGIRVMSTNELHSVDLDDTGNVIHLHGSIEKPETMIVTTRQYLEHYDNKNVQAFLTHLFKKKTVVFLGYGLNETELLEHILRRGTDTKENTRRKLRKLFCLQGFFSSEKPLYEHLYSYYKESFGLELLGFLKDHKSYKCLDEIVSIWADNIIVNDFAILQGANAITEVLGT
ncbi:MAG: hypothetical protein F4039_02290 [Gammaproteobacteria bacterium]|nr:hypothetical protein [Gammaproteobacteria bacterium]MYF53859.1 hypothetical protein [Gammaproteobacteria bacterium]MYK42904.1 hypothetical protein [Gammaproteobacteria bacterium]